MKVKLITTISDQSHPGWKTLERSLIKFGWDYDVMQSDYHGFGTKMVNAYNYAKTTDCTHLFIVDAYDVVVLGTMSEALEKLGNKDMVWNAEKAAWPYEQWGMLYPEVDSEWKYLNGGACFVEVKKFIQMLDDYPIMPTDNDQVVLAATYIVDRNSYGMSLDTACKAFQSYAHIADDDYAYRDGRLWNIKNETCPVIIHGNGHTDMSKIIELI